MMEQPWIFSNENLILLNSIIEQSQQQSENGIQSHLQTLFRNNLNVAENINDTTINFPTSIINISSDEENDEEMNKNQLQEVMEEQEVLIDDISDDFKYLLDNFENENCLLSEHDFIQIMKSNKIDNIFQFLEQKFSLEGLYKFCIFLSSMENIENDILKSFCTELLYPKFMNSPINTSLQIAIQEIFKKYEDIISEKLLQKLVEHKNQNLRVLITICDKLNFNNKYLVLSKLLNSCDATINEEQLELIQTLFVEEIVDENLKLRLINLLYDFADVFSMSKIYGKLLITFIKSLKDGELMSSSDVKNTLELIVMKNKSIYRRVAEKLIENMKN